MAIAAEGQATPPPPSPPGRAIGRLERLAYERALRDRDQGVARGLWFDEAAASHVVRFFGMLRHHKGEFAGQPFNLQPWQRFILRQVFGWKRADGRRRFRTAYVEVGRKNGKTEMAAGVGLYLTYADGESGAEVYAAATKRDQAKLAHSAAKAMVRASPLLSQAGEVLRNNINVPASGSKFEPLGADANTLDGLNPHGLIIDELHAHRDRTVWDVLTTAQGARRQPLTFVITTAGLYRPESIGWEQHDHAVKVLEGALEDDEFFALVCKFDPEDDWADPAVWGKANPNLGVSLYADYLAGQFERAKSSPGFLNSALRFHGGLWTQQVTRWLDMERWNDEGASSPLPDLSGQECWGGLDLASTIDLAALVLAFRDPENAERVCLLCRFWCPEERVLERAKRDMAPYDAWVRDGLLVATPGDRIDYGAIKAEIAALGKRYRIREIAFDRWNASQLVTELQGDGLTMVQFGQGWASMNAPSKELERLVTARLLRHGGNAPLRWMASNVAVAQDPAGNLKPDRKRSGEKIDGIVAACMALGRLVVQGGKGPSAYEGRGIRVFGGEP